MSLTWTLRCWDMQQKQRLSFRVSVRTKYMNDIKDGLGQLRAGFYRKLEAKSINDNWNFGLFFFASWERRQSKWQHRNIYFKACDGNWTLHIGLILMQPFNPFLNMISPPFLPNLLISIILSCVSSSRNLVVFRLQNHKPMGKVVMDSVYLYTPSNG